MAKKKPKPKPKPAKPQKGEIAVDVQRLWEAADKLRGTVDAAFVTANGSIPPTPQALNRELDCLSSVTEASETAICKRVARVDRSHPGIDAIPNCPWGPALGAGCRLLSHDTPSWGTSGLTGRGGIVVISTTYSPQVPVTVRIKLILRGCGPPTQVAPFLLLGGFDAKNALSAPPFLRFNLGLHPQLSAGSSLLALRL